MLDQGGFVQEVCAQAHHAAAGGLVPLRVASPVQRREDLRGQGGVPCRHDAAGEGLQCKAGELVQVVVPFASVGLDGVQEGAGQHDAHHLGAGVRQVQHEHAQRSGLAFVGGARRQQRRVHALLPEGGEPGEGGGGGGQGAPCALLCAALLALHAVPGLVRQQPCLDKGVSDTAPEGVQVRVGVAGGQGSGAQGREVPSLHGPGEQRGVGGRRARALPRRVQASCCGDEAGVGWVDQGGGRAAAAAGGADEVADGPMGVLCVQGLRHAGHDGGQGLRGYLCQPSLLHSEAGQLGDDAADDAANGHAADRCRVRVLDVGVASAMCVCVWGRRGGGVCAGSARGN